MTELTFELDTNASQTVNDLMRHYGLRTRAELFSKAINFLKIAAYVETTHGELVARKDGHETKLLI